MTTLQLQNGELSVEGYLCLDNFVLQKVPAVATRTSAMLQVWCEQNLDTCLQSALSEKKNQTTTNSECDTHFVTTEVYLVQVHVAKMADHRSDERFVFLRNHNKIWL